ncbi:hypothetical protein NL676_031443 [Syzygium grande]|nr:hypothetical protein NL676_031443 [Syzygium grande]
MIGQLRQEEYAHVRRPYAILYSYTALGILAKEKCPHSMAPKASRKLTKAGPILSLCLCLSVSVRIPRLPSVRLQSSSSGISSSQEQRPGRMTVISSTTEEIIGYESFCCHVTTDNILKTMMVVGRTCLTVSPRLSISVLILVLLLLLFPPSASHGTSWRAGESANTAPYSSEKGNRNTKMARDLVVGGYSSALVDVAGSARQVPTGPDPLHHRRKPVSP